MSADVWDTPPKLIELSGPQKWARQVQSNKRYRASTSGAYRTEPVLNAESRQVLYALAGELLPGARVVVVEFDALKAATGYSSRRINWCLRALHHAILIGPVTRQKAGGKTYLKVPLYVGGGNCATRCTNFGISIKNRRRNCLARGG